MKNSIKAVNLDKIEIPNNIQKDYGIYVSEKKGEIFREIKREFPQKKCYICKKEKKIQKSHTVPDFILQNIKYQVVKNQDKICSANAILSNYKGEIGIKKAGIFEMICNKCDIEYFNTYEHEIPKIELDKIDNKLLREIELKNILKAIDKKNFEKTAHKIQYINFRKIYIFLFNFILNYPLIKLKKNNFIFIVLLKIIETEKKDCFYYYDFENSEYNEFKKVFNTIIKKETSKEDKDKKKKYFKDKEYKIHYKNILQYRVPLAFQGIIGLIIDFNGNYINNPLNDKDNEVFSLCIFPFDKKSIILIFSESNNKSYDNFFYELNNYDENKQLGIINYILFSYTDDYFYYPNLPKKIINKLTNLASKTPAIKVPNSMTETEKKQKILYYYKKLYNYKEYIKYPNLLSKEFAINEEVVKCQN